MESSGEPYNDDTDNSSWGTDEDDEGGVRDSNEEGERDDLGLTDVQYHDNGTRRSERALKTQLMLLF